MEVAIRAVAAGGAGVGELPDGRVVFVQRTAPGDRALVRVTRRKRSWARGRLLELLEPGPERRPAPCPHYDRCGGCTLEHLRYRSQLAWKGRLIADALERIGGLAVPAPEVEPSPSEFRYRNRVTFALRRLAGGRVVAGFHALESPGRIVDLGAGCLLPEEPVARLWAALREGWGPGADRLPEGRALRLTLRGTAGGGTLIVHGGRGEGDAEELVREVPGLVSVWKEDREGGPVRRLAGPDAVVEEWYGDRFEIRGNVFLQVNREAAERVHEATLREVGAPRGLRVLEGYCGMGVYGRRLARHGARVLGIELDPDAVAAARRGAPEGFRVVEGRVEDRLGEALRAGDHWDVVLLNPPRTGLADSVPPTLVEAGPPRLVYVSCDPATLARDTARLAPGYRLERLRAFDLFPQTTHVETLATFARTAAA